MRNIKAGAIAAIALAIGGTALATQGAYASAEGSRNTAIALGAGSIYELSQHNTGAGVLLGLGAVIAGEQAAQQECNRPCCTGGYYHYDGGFDRDRGGNRDNDWDRGRDNRGGDFGRRDR